MTRQTITVIKCDKCEEEIPSELEIFHVKSEACTDYQEYIDWELCRDCHDKLLVWIKSC